jgi:hypothetical protein
MLFSIGKIIIFKKICREQFRLGTTDEALFKSDSKFRVISQDKTVDGTYQINLKEID